MDRIIELREKSGCEAIFIASELGCYYLTGFHSDFSFIIADKDNISYYTDKRYYEEAKSKLSITVKLITGDNYLEILRQGLSSYKKIGFDETKVYYSDYLKLKSIMPEDVQFIGNIMQDLRSVKSAEEILITECAVDIADEVFDKVLGKIKEGITEKELAFMIDSEMIAAGADGIAFNTIVAFSENAAHPHWTKSDRKLKHGDCILMDYGARYKGYNSDMTRVVNFGKASEEFKRIYNIVKDANQRAIDGIREDMTAKDADSFARSYIESFGLGDNFNHSLGHGIGIEVHEFPRLAPTSDVKLLRGMIFTIEPGVYLPGSFGVRIEDLVCLTDKVHPLTKSSKELIEL